MRRRRSNSDESSLELLLDTITNTFGGIVFIALLVVLLLGQKSSSSEANAESERIKKELEVELANYEQQLKQLEQQRTSLQESTLNKELRENQAKLQEIRKRESDIVQLENEFKNKSAETKELRELTEESEKTAEETVKQLEDLKAEVAMKTQELNAARLASSEEGALPFAKVTRKRSIPIFLRRNRLYVLHQNMDVLDFKLNSKDFATCSMEDAEVQSSKGNFVTREDGGAAISDQADDLQIINQIISKIDGEQYYVTVAIFYDSFDSFRELKKAIVARKLEYRLLLLPKDGKITETRSAGETKVQ